MVQRFTAVHSAPRFKALIRCSMSYYAFSVGFDVGFFFYPVFILGCTFDLLFSISVLKKINNHFESLCILLGKLFIHSQLGWGLIYTLDTACILFLSQAFSKPEVQSRECIEKKIVIEMHGKSSNSLFLSFKINILNDN